MSRSPLIVEVESSYLKKDAPVFSIGDTVRVQTKIVEGEKERIQAFTGTVIAKKGTGLSETFTVYRTAYGSSMERVFLLHSPRIAGVEVMRPGKVRRAKLYYIRGRSGKATKIRELYVAGSSEEKAEAAPSENQ
ncbi:MAG: 50S ribosomal protein L19 [Verrucomicrobia bacterium]|nr:50S ribosomal protein L19 [Verrucomicrobiota bacterium]